LETTRTSSPAEKQLATAASIAPVPEEAMVYTGALVPNSGGRPPLISWISCSISVERWWMISRAPASSKRCGTSVGPGVASRSFTGCSP
jgi:hypothetical protein